MRAQRLAARQVILRGQKVPAQRLGLRPARPGLGHADADPLAPAQKDQAQRQRQEPRPVALGRPRGITRPAHPRRARDPQRRRLRGLPLAFAHESRVGSGRAAPVDQSRRIARHGGAVLPEILARARTAQTMRARIDRDGQTLGGQHQLGQAGGGGFGAQAQRDRVLARGPAGAAGPEGAHRGAQAAARRLSPISRAITASADSPRARAAKDSAMR